MEGDRGPVDAGIMRDGRVVRDDLERRQVILERDLHRMVPLGYDDWAKVLVGSLSVAPQLGPSESRNIRGLGGITKIGMQEIIELADADIVMCRAPHTCSAGSSQGNIGPDPPDKVDEFRLVRAADPVRPSNGLG